LQQIQLQNRPILLAANQARIAFYAVTGECWHWTAWDFGLLGFAAYIAVMALVRLMSNRREMLLRDLESQAAREQSKKNA